MGGKSSASPDGLSGSPDEGSSGVAGPPAAGGAPVASRPGGGRLRLAASGPPDQATYATGTEMPASASVAPRQRSPCLPLIMNSPETARYRSNTA
jgi:hypothetical protein